ncbi:MAG: dicarboxylate/amino acid:cation symporter [candidate division Zixibacteria bacterium]|nr:dicarboxylate/amino acid:cation symporter [candidate division Zixibacteria bacterium]
MKLHRKILLGMVAGAGLGLASHFLFYPHPILDWIIGNIAYPVGQIFFRLIFMVVLPLVFSALVLGVCELGNLRHLGRVGARTLIFTAVVSTISVLIGVGLVNLVKPGEGIAPEARDRLISSLAGESFQQEKAQILEKAKGVQSPAETIVNFFPRNPVSAAVNAFQGEMLAFMVFAVLFGVALTLVKSERTKPLTGFLEGVYDVVMKLIELAMKLAPYGVAALIFTATARTGLEVVALLSKYVLVVIVGLALHQFVVYSILVKYLAKISPRVFFSRISEVMVTAFSTSSSNATLPTTMRESEEKLGIPRRIGGFVLTLGSSLNQNGTALYEGVTVLFIAQLFGADLSFGTQLTVIFLSVLAGIGTAGVPAASLPLIVIVLQTIGVPGEGIIIILGVDRILDMCRTVVNVTGDIAAAAYIARSENCLKVPTGL